MYTKESLRKKAIKFCVPAFEKAINNLESDFQYVVTDHVGYEPTRLEELLRPLWGFAPVLADEKEKIEITVCGEKRELCSEIRRIVSEGTDEKSEKCFSKNVTPETEFTYANQSITEFAGYMIALYYASNVLWDPYTDEEKERIASWIKKWAVAALKDSWPNNHYWFPMLSIMQLERMGFDCGDIEADMQNGFDVLDSLYLGDGWYKDGEFGRFDYYQAWSLHTYPALYALMSEGTRFYDEKRVTENKKRCEDFIPYFSHLFDTNGSYVAFGRSLSYRFGAVAVYGAASILNCDIDYAMARRIVFKNIEYFENNMLEEADGVLAPGYLYYSPQLVENYTSSGGAYWSSKAFIVLSLPDSHPFWNEEEKALFSEMADYVINTNHHNINLVVDSSKDYSGVTLFNNSATYYQKVFTNRFNDMASYYSKFCYNSRSGFAVATPDRPSLDNNIVVRTPDYSMYSMRKRMTDLGFEDGVLISEHLPYYNDKETHVKSWVIPLRDGYHIRAHRVTLSQEYIVSEGGFSVGVFNDNNIFQKEENGFKIRSAKGLVSSVYTLSSCDLVFNFEIQQPGCHILAPQSYVPTYTTGILPAGTYYFASVFMFTTGKESPNIPEISLNGAMLKLKQCDISKTINLDS